MLNILAETDQYIVVNKPAGLIVHPINEQDDQHTLVTELLDHVPDIKDVGENLLRPGLVHRLDKNVSGVMVIAKTQEMFTHLKAQFQDRKVEKFYLALVYGSVSKDHDLINFNIARSKSTGKMIARPISQEGREALTEYDVLDRFATTTYVKVQIHTGRTHQIRVHFRAIDHPVVGDNLYKKKLMRKTRPIEMDRLFLHATELTFDDLEGERIKITCPLPAELEDILATQSRV